jgi:hypothetical protein
MPQQSATSLKIPIQTVADAYIEAGKLYREASQMPHFIEFTQEADGQISYSFSQ